MNNKCDNAEFHNIYFSFEKYCTWLTQHIVYHMKAKLYISFMTWITFFSTLITILYVFLIHYVFVKFVLILIAAGYIIYLRKYKISKEFYDQILQDLKEREK